MHRYPDLRLAITIILLAQPSADFSTSAPVHELVLYCDHLTHNICAHHHHITPYLRLVVCDHDHHLSVQVESTAHSTIALQR